MDIIVYLTRHFVKKCTIRKKDVKKRFFLSLWKVCKNLNTERVSGFYIYCYRNIVFQLHCVCSVLYLQMRGSLVGFRSHT